MPPRERPVDRGQRLGSTTLGRIGEELRLARVNRGLTIAAVGRAVGISTAELSRIERSRAPRVPFIALARIASAVGLDLSARLYPGGTPIRDAAQIALLSDFSLELASSLRWDTEVPLPLAGDPRAWDGMIRGPDWRFGVEAESSPRDGQALVRRLHLKLRDGAVDGVILLVRDTRQTRLFLDGAELEFAALLPLSSRQILGALRRGERPSGNGIVVVSRRQSGPGSPNPGPTAPAVGQLLRPTIQANEKRGPAASRSAPRSAGTTARSDDGIRDAPGSSGTSRPRE